MNRRLFNVLAGVSLLLFLATAVLWSTCNRTGEWRYFATYWRGPVVRRDYLEFGELGPVQPVRPLNAAYAHGWCFSFPGGYLETEATINAPDVEDIPMAGPGWRFGGFGIRSGMIIPPWGWTAGHPWAQQQSGQTSVDLPTLELPYKECDVPLAYLQWLFALAPTLWLLMRLLPFRKSAHGHCPACGYDLRATPDRCPECGATPQEAMKRRNGNGAR